MNESTVETSMYRAGQYGPELFQLSKIEKSLIEDLEVMYSQRIGESENQVKKISTSLRDIMDKQVKFYPEPSNKDSAEKSFGRLKDTIERLREIVIILDYPDDPDKPFCIAGIISSAICRDNGDIDLYLNDNFFENYDLFMGDEN